MINGKLNIYYYRDEEHKDHYLVDKKDLPLKVIPFNEDIRFRDDGTRVLYQSKYHVGLLQLYTNDAVGFNKAVNIHKPDHNNLIKFAEDYHNTVCLDEKCIIYQKDVPFIKASFELQYGQTYFSKKYIDADVHTSEIGLGIYFWMPRMSERFYFKTGINHCELNDEGEKLIYKVIPTQIQYQYPHYKLVPKLFFGFNNYIYDVNLLYWTLTPGTGLDYKFSKRFSLTSSFYTEFVPLAFRVGEILSISDEESISLISYSFRLGLRIDL
ncbi:MAG: hypothetical protein HC896_13380 [Bacteroidales bacterium]|nr:hypothetical protein [Bacteroidales bacterium]